MAEFGENVHLLPQTDNVRSIQSIIRDKYSLDEVAHNLNRTKSNSDLEFQANRLVTCILVALTLRFD